MSGDGAPQAGPPESSGRATARGMAWTAVSLTFAKSLSLVSQIALGYLLSVETYAVFALVSTALMFVSGFQNPGVNKALVQEHEQFDEIVGPYTSFALILAIGGYGLLLAIGAGFEGLYGVDQLFWIVATHGLTVPMMAVSLLHVSLLSIQLRFRAISFVDIAKSLTYYPALICLAALGADGYTMAVAFCIACLVELALLRRAAPGIPLSLRISARQFVRIAGRLRWVIASALLFTIAQRGDYFALGLLLDPRELGYYYFGFSLVANVTVMLAVGINRTLLPVFSKIRNDRAELRRQIYQSAGAIAILCGVICIGLVGFSPVLVHAIWGGKWDGCIVVVLAFATSLPLRLMANIGGTMMESDGAWARRLVYLVLDVLLLLSSAALGAWLAGLVGAAVAVGVQRAVSGLVTFEAAIRLIGGGQRRLITFGLRCFGPFLLVLAGLFWLAPDRHLASQSALAAAAETAAALLVYVLLNALFNRDLLKKLVQLVPRGRPTRGGRGAGGS